MQESYYDKFIKRSCYKAYYGDIVDNLAVYRRCFLIDDAFAKYSKAKDSKAGNDIDGINVIVRNLPQCANDILRSSALDATLS